jgi:hypothetical protein
MSSHDFSIENEIKGTEIKRPHVVILGAGASLAAFPNGDGNGRRLPVMKNFVEVVGLANVFSQNAIDPPYDDFEGIYSDIAADPNKTSVQVEIEKRGYDYFASLELPDTPTLYDHLILSLRPKDVIATFNWDPFLWQAASRNYGFGGVPHLRFLHGNVAIGYCPDCKVVIGRHQHCSRCGKSVLASPLLYPVKRKNYQSDPAIASHWRSVMRALEDAWTVTFFGYGAPKTDVEAVELLKNGWGDVEKRNLEETEIIDVRPENELTTTWEPFIHTHHYRIRKSFYDSYIGKHPRRSCEALWACLMECQFLQGTDIPQNASFDDLYKWFRPRIDAEQSSMTSP